MYWYKNYSIRYYIIICIYYREYIRFIGYNLMILLECCIIFEMFIGEVFFEFEFREIVGGMLFFVIGLLVLVFFSRF